MLARLWKSADGSFGVDKVPASRVYHINVVLQLKSSDAVSGDHTTVLQKCVRFCEAPALEFVRVFVAEISGLGGGGIIVSGGMVKYNLWFKCCGWY